MKMRRLLISTICFLINIFLVWSIGTLGLQEYLTLLIYFIPICVDLFIIFIIFKHKTKSIIITLLVLLLLFLLLLIVCGFIFYHMGAFTSSIIALCVFMFVFNVFPLLIVIIIISAKRHKG